ncbi:MAG: DUF2169 domain-containing protein [Deltaproteobacteria bacterium]|nr:DUF2169 domain-containing protein [Deltaproteobacteria bacterium]
MKALKPQRLGLLQRVVEHDRRCTLVVSVLVYVPLASPRKPLTESSLWRELAGELPNGVLDEGLPKPRGEVLVTGRAFAPGGKPAGAVMVRLVLGELDKKLAVLGDRYWKNGTPTEPVPFAEMPIDYAHGFGGEGYAPNPLGKGVVPIETEHGPVLPLPNIEDPARLIASRGDRPPPAGFGPYDLTWPQRFEKVGQRYDEKWLRTRFPGPAEDFDAHFYNAAPADQQIDGFFAGDERFVLEGMHPSLPRLEGALERLVVRVFATQRDDADEHFRELGTRLDTVHFFPHLGRALCIYRGTLPVAEDDAGDIVHLVVAAEDPAHPKPVEHYQRVLAKRLDKDKGALASLQDQDLMPPESAGWAARLDPGDLGEMTRLEQRTLQNMERGRERRLAEGRAELAAAGFDPDEGAPELPDLGPLPDPYDFDAVTEYLEKAEREAEKLQAEAERKGAELEQQAKAAFAEAGFDWEAEKDKAMAEAGGLPKFSADEHLVMLHDMARIAREGDQPMEDLERDLTDPRFEQMLRDLEERVRAAYVASAHLLPAAGAVGHEEREMLRVVVGAAKAAGESLAGRNLTRADLRGLDLRGMDLSGVLLEGADLSGADLSDADLSGAVLARADLTGAILSGAKLRGTNLGASLLKGTDLSGAQIEEAALGRAVLDGAVLLGARLHEVDFLETEFAAADFSHLESSRLLFLKADLRRVAFTGARLSEARFIEVDLRGVDFTGADLDRAQFIMCRGDGACFAGARLGGAVFVHESSFAGCSFAEASLAGANFRQTPLAGGDFRGAALAGADLSGCDLTGASFHRIRARAARFIRARLAGANLRGADLLDATLSKAVLAGADLTGANLSRADLSRVRTDGATNLEAALMLDTRLEPKHDGAR